MTEVNKKSSQVVVDPADMTGVELYDHLSKQFHPFAHFCQMTGIVNSNIRQLERSVEWAIAAAIPALDTANQYPGSNLQKDLSQNYQKLLALKDFLSNFEPLPEVELR